MCLGILEEVATGALSAIIMVALPVIGLVRLGKYLFYDLPRSFLKKKVEKAPEIPQPPTLQITIPVSEDPC
jgi:hypothetical protein